MVSIGFLSGLAKGASAAQEKSHELRLRNAALIFQNKQFEAGVDQADKEFKARREEFDQLQTIREQNLEIARTSAENAQKSLDFRLNESKARVSAAERREVSDARERLTKVQGQLATERAKFGGATPLSPDDLAAVEANIATLLAEEEDIQRIIGGLDPSRSGQGGGSLPALPGAGSAQAPPQGQAPVSPRGLPPSRAQPAGGQPVPGATSPFVTKVPVAIEAVNNILGDDWQDRVERLSGNTFLLPDSMAGKLEQLEDADKFIPGASPFTFTTNKKLAEARNQGITSEMNADATTLSAMHADLLDKGVQKTVGITLSEGGVQLDEPPRIKKLRESEERDQSLDDLRVVDARGEDLSVKVGHGVFGFEDGDEIREATKAMKQGMADLANNPQARSGLAVVIDNTVKDSIEALMEDQAPGPGEDPDFPSGLFRRVGERRYEVVSVKAFSDETLMDRIEAFRELASLSELVNEHLPEKRRIANEGSGFYEIVIPDSDQASSEFEEFSVDATRDINEDELRFMTRYIFKEMPAVERSRFERGVQSLINRVNSGESVSLESMKLINQIDQALHGRQVLSEPPLPVRPKPRRPSFR